MKAYPRSPIRKHGKVWFELHYPTLNMHLKQNLIYKTNVFFVKIKKN